MCCNGTVGPHPRFVCGRRALPSRRTDNDWCAVPERATHAVGVASGQLRAATPLMQPMPTMDATDACTIGDIWRRMEELEQYARLLVQRQQVLALQQQALLTASSALVEATQRQESGGNGDAEHAATVAMKLVCAAYEQHVWDPAAPLHQTGRD